MLMGIGNRDRCDDGAGSAVSDIMSDFVSGEKISDVRIFCCNESPENFTGPVKKENPTHILLIDSCIAGKSPGSIFIINPRRIKDIDISSHKMPLGLLYRYLKEEIGADILIIGIEPQHIEQGRFFSEPVAKAVVELTNFLKELLKSQKK